MDRATTSVGNRRRTQGGFTLVEMAIVLVIIGLIIAAVSVGRDIQQSAEQARVIKWMEDWAQTYRAYYNREGIVFGDSRADVTLLVNQGTGAVADDGLRNALATAGLSVPNSNQTNGNEFEYNPPGIPRVTLAISFTSVEDWGLPDEGETHANVMQIDNVPGSLAAALSARIDGANRSAAGDVRDEGSYAAYDRDDGFDATEDNYTVYWLMDP